MRCSNMAREARMTSIDTSRTRSPHTVAEPRRTGNAIQAADWRPSRDNPRRYCAGLQPGPR